MKYAVERFAAPPLVVLLLILALPSPATATSFDLGELGINGLAVAPHPGGGWWVVGTDELGTRLEGVRVAADGTVATRVVTPELHPIAVLVEAVAVAPSGRWLVVWSPEASDFVSGPFRAAILEPNGTLVAEPDLSVPDETFPAEPRSAVTAAAPDGGFWVAWGARTSETLSADGSNYVADLFVARFAASGERTAGPVRVNEERIGHQRPFGLAAHADAIVVAWDSDGPGNAFVHARVLRPDLSLRSSVIEVSREDDPPLAQSGELLAIGPSGHFTVVSSDWQAGRVPGQIRVQIVFRSFDLDGARVSPATAVRFDPSGPNPRAAAATPEGVVWLIGSIFGAPPPDELGARPFSLAGEVLGPLRPIGLPHPHGVEGRGVFAAGASGGRVLVVVDRWPEPSDGAVIDEPALPDERALTSPELPGYRVWVLFDGQSPAPRWGTEEPGCLAETLCASGAVPGRTEVLVRVVGPKPNGFLWPTLVKLSTSPVEVWIEQVETGEVRHYLLPGASPGVDVLPGLFDRFGFPPN